jgi:peptidoglycan hydrolase CwlO-like protein
MKKQDIKKQIESLEKKHDKIVNPICYTGNCPICQKINELREKIKVIKEKVRNK